MIAFTLNPFSSTADAELPQQQDDNEADEHQGKVSKKF